MFKPIITPEVYVYTVLFDLGLESCVTPEKETPTPLLSGGGGPLKIGGQKIL